MATRAPPTDYITTWRGRPGYGNMDYYMFQRRYQRPTEEDTYDSREVVREYQRDVMRDMIETNGPLLESDIRGTHNLGREWLNMREMGLRASSDPRIYDDQGYYHDFMDQDPRSWTGEHRWDNFRNIVENRIWGYPFADSLEKDSIDEMSPFERIERLRWWLDYMRATHWNFFSTSKENYINGGVMVLGRNRAQNELLVHQLTKTPSHTLWNSSTTVLSNDIRYPGYLSVPDHEVDVGRYGLVYGLAPFMDHNSAVNLIRGEDIFQDSKQMRDLSCRFRNLSETRQLLNNFIWETLPGDEHQSDPRKVGMVSEIVALMDLTATDLTDHTFEIKPGQMPRMSEPAKLLVEQLMSMPDSERAMVRKTLLQEVSLAASRRNTFASLDNDLRTLVGSKTPMPSEIKNVINKQIAQMNSDSANIRAGKHPGADLIPTGGRPGDEDIHLTRDTRKVMPYGAMMLPTGTPNDTREEMHSPLPDTIKDALKGMQRLSPNIVKTTERNATNQDVLEDRIFKRRELPTIGLKARANNVDFDYRSTNYDS